MLSRVFDKYKKLSVVAKASLWFMFCTMVQKCLAIITTPIFTRIMDTTQYGMYSTYLSVTSILTVVLTLNFDTCAYMNGIAKFDDKKEKKELASSLLILTIIITLVFTGVISIFQGKFSKIIALPEMMINLMLVEILFIPPVRFWLVEQRFAYKYVSLVVVTLGMLITNNAIGVVFVLFAQTNQAVMRVFSIALVQAIVGTVLFARYFKQTGKFRVTKYWGYGLKLNLPLIPHGLSLIFLSSSDRIMINTMVGAVQAGIYGVAYSAGQIINAIKLSLVDAIRPWMYEKLKTKEYDNIKKTCQFLLLINVLLTFIVVGLAPEIIKILAAKEYYEAIYIIPPVAASSYFTFVYNICAIVEIFYEKNKSVMFVSVVAALSNLVLNYIFIPRYGYLAAGYTTLVSYMLLSIMHFYFLKKIQHESMDGESIVDTKRTVATSVVVLTGMVVFTVLYRYTIVRMILVCILIGICFAMRKHIISVITSVKKKKGEKANG